MTIDSMILTASFLLAFKSAMFILCLAIAFSGDKGAVIRWTYTLLIVTEFCALAAWSVLISICWIHWETEWWAVFFV